MAGKPKKRHPVTQPSDPSYKIIALTRGQNALVDTEDFEWLSKYNWFAHWCPDTRSFYALRAGPNHRSIPMHREILNCSPRQQGDHINHDTLDNRKLNLRKCRKAMNNRNQRRRIDNTSGFKGVSWHYNKWRSRIMVNKIPMNIGGFDTIEEAARAYDAAAKEFHGEFAYFNFPNK